MRISDWSSDVCSSDLVTNSVLWADVAHPINIGLHGSREQPEVIENIVFRNIDVLGHDEDDRNYQGVMAISDGDNNLVRNVLFEDFRIDRKSVVEGKGVYVRVDLGGGGVIKKKK